MKIWSWVFVVVCLGRLPCWSIDPAHVIILVNEADDESIDLGYYYALKREVPLENIVHLPLPAEEAITWDTFIESLYNPMMAWLIESGSFEGFGSERIDALGRNVSIVNAHTVEALVICKGVPLRIENDPARLPPKDTYSEDRLPFYTNRASVDSELALLPLPKANIDAFYPNPMFRLTKPRRLFDVTPLVVGRLDGPSYELAQGLIDNALKAEKEGVAGRAYIDMGGPHEKGDLWFEELAELLEKKGFDVDKHSDKGRFNRVDRFDEPLLYFGWYSGGVDGPFTNYNFSFPTGAIAMHLHSFSASTVRDGRKGWVGPLVARGVTATFGNTSEPYLYFTHQPQLVVEGLFKGLTLGQVALYSHPGLSWAGVFFGDPLYLPPLGVNVSPINEYGAIRLATVAQTAGDASAYKAIIVEHDRTHHFSTGLWLCNYFLEHGERDKAYEYLASSLRPSADSPHQWGVLVAMAKAYLNLDHQEEGVSILNDLLSHMKESNEAQKQLLNRALEFATEFELAKPEEFWRSQLEALMPPADQ